ncbi:hypothetical protein KFZ70_10450 [Tamlana fucoidanivorans]|uniref:Uncharacterized protein n=1 Tax=Allotamlana fucoidanivorans TaxID=2583814 RepID=A0A5C4SNN4_9FLAO|nr:hypothetical protein [Tamlana fucoidanivorans]TNJ45718.1 hypothetical protein FGF67_04875 [Tamlana fucoidanivorans]
MSHFFKHKLRGKSPGAIAGMIIFGAITITGLAILFAFVIMWLWNWLMPELFHLATITFWQAAGIFILSKILIGGCNGFGSKSESSSNDSECEKEFKSKFSKWKYYDQFWKEEGNEAYEAYVSRIKDHD